MASQGPLVRVDTDGRKNLLKMSRAAAERYIATHPGASLVGAPPPAPAAAPPAPPPPVAAPTDERPLEDKIIPFGNLEAAPAPAGKPLERMNKAELKAFALALGLSTDGSNAELLERIKSVPASNDEAEPPTEAAPPEE